MFRATYIESKPIVFIIICIIIIGLILGLDCVFVLKPNRCAVKSYVRMDLWKEIALSLL